MKTSWLLWLLPALLLFWGLGAYNRLVRLRSEAIGSFGEVDTQLARQVEFIGASLPSPDDPGHTAELAALWKALHAAATQLSVGLAATRNRPLDAAATSALSAAGDAVRSSWSRVQGDAHDLAGSAVPESIAAVWQQLESQSQHARDRFNHAVTRYNGGIRQFPALLIARTFGLRAAGLLTSPPGGAQAHTAVPRADGQEMR